MYRERRLRSVSGDPTYTLDFKTDLFHGVRGRKIPRVLPPCGWSHGFLTVPRTAGRRFLNNIFLTPRLFCFFNILIRSKSIHKLSLNVNTAAIVSRATSRSFPDGANITALCNNWNIITNVA